MYQRAAYQRLRKEALEKHTDLIEDSEALPDEVIFNKLRLRLKAGFYLDTHVSDNLTEYSFYARFRDRMYRWDRNHYHSKHEHAWREDQRISLADKDGIDDSTMIAALSEVIRILKEWISDGKIP